MFNTCLRTSRSSATVFAELALLAAAVALPVRGFFLGGMATPGADVKRPKSPAFEPSWLQVCKAHRMHYVVLSDLPSSAVFRAPDR